MRGENHGVRRPSVPLAVPIPQAPCRRGIDTVRKPLRDSYRAAIQSCGATLDVRRMMRRTRTQPVNYATLAEWRYQLRLLLGRREAAARAAGVEPQQYMLLLQIKGLEVRADHRHARRADPDSASQRSRAGGPFGEARTGGAAAP